MKNETKFWIAVLITLVIVIGRYFFPHLYSGVGAISETDVQSTNFTQLYTANGIKIGSSGNGVTQALHGTCTLVSDSSIAATSTGTGTCVTTGSVAGDQVFISLATTTTKMAAQWNILGTVAGTDTTTVRLQNNTGTAAVPSATNGLGSSTQYWIVR